MGMRSSKQLENLQTSDLEFSDNINHKLDIDKKDTIIFPNNKITEISDNKSYNTNISITEELNKSTKMDSTFDNQSELVPFKFEWKVNNNNENKEIEVMIAGTFLNNWNTFIKMDKNPETNIYEYKTLLKREKHFFKYLINNKWLCSDLYPKVQDNSNNTNNFIDLTNCDVNLNINDNISENKNEITVKKEKNKKRKKFENNRKNEGYGLNFPLIKDLNGKAPIVMDHYKETFLIDNQSNQDKLFSLNQFSDFQKCHSNGNRSYKQIYIFPHEKLGHITPNIYDILYNKNYNRYCFTERKKHKYLTLVYYKPKYTILNYNRI